MTESRQVSVLEKYSQLHDKENFNKLNEEMSYGDYLALVQEKPELCRNSFQYIYDMIMSAGTSTFERYRKTYTRYHFFDQSHEDIKIFGIEKSLQEIVDFIRGAAGHFGTEKRVMLLHGPVGSAKSTICRLLKRGLEDYSRSDEGAWYTYRWKDLPYEADNEVQSIYTTGVCDAALNDNPLRLMPEEMREEFLRDINQINLGRLSKEDRTNAYRFVCKGDPNPRCRLFLNELLRQNNGDWGEVMKKHIVVVRKCHSEVDRVGIGTFQPKDEKNQDSTELTGDMNFSKIAHFGSDSDPRAFNFDGEFQVGNRGVVEFIEMLKLANEFLYDLLGVAQEHQIKPKKFSQIVVDELIIAHTNNPEYEKLKSNQYMEALRDRTVKIDIPYLLRQSDELKIYEQDYGPDKISHHLMPHSLEICAFFAIATRIVNDPESKLSLRDQVKLYDGKDLPGWTEDSVKELQDRNPDEGMKKGVSARFIQEKISNCLSRHKDYVNVFHLLNEIKEGLDQSSLITDASERDAYKYCVEETVQELEDILKNEVQRALVADENAIERLCNKYIDNLLAYVNDEKIENKITGRLMNPDERLMRSIEEKAKIPEQGSDDFRRSIATFIGTMAQRKQEFSWKSNVELKKALEAKVFEDVRDTIKLSSLTKEAADLDPDLQEKIDAIKTRLIKNYGYNEQSAKDVLEFVSGIFARGDVSSDD